MAESTTPSRSPAHVALATVFQVRDGDLTVLLWERAREPFSGSWALPGGTLAAGETLEASISRHLATKVDVREVSHLEQLGTWSDPGRHPDRWELATAYLGLVPLGMDPRVPADKKPCGDRPAVAGRHLKAGTSRRGALQNAAALQLPTSRLRCCRISRRKR